MAEEKDILQAKAAYKTLCDALDHNGWHYEKKEEQFIIECGAQGEDLPMHVTVMVSPDRLMVNLLSHLPFTIPEEKRVDVAIAVTTVNNRLVDGSFDYDIGRGHLFFRMNNSIRESNISEEVFMYLILCSCQTIDNYNDKLLMLIKGTLTLEQFLSSNN